MIRVLVVDDEPLAVEAHSQYLGRIDGFELSGTATSIREARIRLLAAQSSGFPINLILLDLTLADTNGLDLARSLRSAQVDIDIIVITAIRQTASVQAALAVGVVHYLIKPFGFSTFNDKLEHYARYRDMLHSVAGTSTQAEVDELVASTRSSRVMLLPKGLTSLTLDAISAHLRAQGAALSATETASALVMSRVTARRYLEHLADLGMAARTQRYGTPGRPEVAYSWI